MENVNQRVALVTGGGRGIGAAIAKLLGANGYAVAVNFASDAAAAQSIVDHVTRNGSRAIAIQGDVSHEDDVLRVFATTERELGPIHALVNNAAITGGFARVDEIEITLEQVVGQDGEQKVLQQAAGESDFDVGAQEPRDFPGK